MTVARRCGVVGLACLAAGATCHKSPAVEFPRPPATASVPESPPPSGPPTAPTDSPPPDAGTPSPPTSRPQPEPSSPPPEPEVPPSRTSRSSPGKEDPAAIQDKIRRTEAVLEIVSGRSLSKEGRDQLVAARTFVLQAKDALVSGDAKRAGVLAEKAYILAQDVERSSRE